MTKSILLLKDYLQTIIQKKKFVTNKWLIIFIQKNKILKMGKGTELQNAILGSKKKK